MPQHVPVRVRRHAAAVIAVSLVTPVLCPAHAAATVPHAPLALSHEANPVRHTSLGSGLSGLVELVVERLLLADAVAAAKFGGTSPVADPERERALLGKVATLSARTGLPAETGVRFFRAQIEASKVVQRGLHARWRAHPELRPRERPDLASEVRPRLDRLTPRLLRQLKEAEPGRSGPGRCQARLTAARLAAQTRARLDKLHRDALRSALTPVCRVGAVDHRSGAVKGSGPVG
ncbi:gamma subclass chorismate mutase AroQ [Nonomuraea diastatica]|uniref:chorismate mutase n=1 Tax=Nonomuraea diastatica TaxID=1848329 RepID=A0A4R4WU63_9ACTN|nr:gamma subclass chorismate mutase AroQ [Nonomuraea diastatica]TDD21164.1 gamma subclass chorismate mutase AroQ [Nonomuraea diastatica]